MIILGPGSLYTSIIPNLLVKGVVNAIEKSRAKVFYICNIMTQPGETEDFKVCDHVRLLNQYLGKRKIDVVVANSGKIDEEMAKRYESLEQKDPVELDRKETKSMVEKIIADDYVIIKNNLLRHNVLKLGLHIFGYLLEQK